MWHKVLERRADFVNIQADQGQVINDIIDQIMRGYHRHIIDEKEAKKKKSNTEDLAWVLNELKTADYLKMEEIPFERLEQLPREEFINIYDTYFRYDR